MRTIGEPTIADGGLVGRLSWTQETVTLSLAFSDRFRQPDNLSGRRVGILLPGPWEIHGFAPLPHGRFAFIVCNH